MTPDYYSLLPEQVLDAAEQAGLEVTGQCMALGSLENRVYDVGLEDGRHVVAKFYRPGRWSAEAIGDEHRLLAALAAEEIPAVAPLVLADGRTLGQTTAGIHFAVFPRVGGRAPDDLDLDSLEEIGRLLARIHNVSATLGPLARPPIGVQTYGRDALATLQSCTEVPAFARDRLADAAARLIAAAEPVLAAARTFPVHGDCHRGNLLSRPDGWVFLDFDDMAAGPAVQDLWLLLPGRARDCPREVDALLAGYQTFRDFDRAELAAIEALRGLRYLRYAAWIARRWQDPAFPRAFPDWGSERYFGELAVDLYEQAEAIGHR